MREFAYAHRQDSYDWVKGVLVEAMIIYHSVNYFGESSRALNYLDFVTGAFVLLSGRMITRYYLTEYKTRLRLMAQRLLIRSAKLIVIFTALNTAVHLALRNNYNGTELGLTRFYSNLFEVFIVGAKGIASFEILLPIAYTLALGGILAFSLRSKSLLGAVVCGMLGVLLYAEDLSFNLKFLSLGLGGMIYGCFKSEDLSCNGKLWLALSVTVLVAVYFSIITVLDKDNLIIYFVGVWSIVQGLSMVAEQYVHQSWPAAALKLFGKYSLFGYLFQILILQVLFRIVGREVWREAMVVIAVVLVNVLLYFSLSRLSSLEAKDGVVRRTYRMVFA